jgi:lysylphosphatidylglycerol synthetase-like protein (DUF2156 family)
MRLDHLAAATIDLLLGCLLRRALLALVMAAFAIVAIYYFTAAGMLALESRFGDLHAQLIVAAIYTAFAVISFAILWAMWRKSATPNAPALSHPRAMELVMLVEAAMLGYSLARKGERTR